VKEVDEVFDLVRLENVAEGRHGGPTVLDLMLDFFFAQAFAYGAEVRAFLPTAAIYAVAVLAALFVEERGSGVFRVGGVGVNNKTGGPWQAGCQGYDEARETESGTDSR
jgi:hypothetical protein